MRIISALLSLILLTGAGGQSSGPIEVTPENEAELRKRGAEILFWSQEQRDSNFPAMERLFPGNVVEASAEPRPLPEGEPIDFGAGDPVGDHMAAHNIAGLIVLQDGRVRLERYARGHSRAGRYTSFSVAKSITSTLVGAAIADGYIGSVDDPITRYIPELSGSAYDGVSIRQILTMTSGVKWNEDEFDPDSDLARMYRDTPPPGVDPTVHYLKRLPREAEPGKKWTYKTGETNLIGVLVGRATGKTLAAYLSEKIWKPYGMERDGFWMTDGRGHEVGGCCMSASVRDFARFGQFILEGGRAGGLAVVPGGWIEVATGIAVPLGEESGYGYQWWSRADGSASAQGIFGQLIFIDPERRLVIAASGAWPVAWSDELAAERRAFVNRVRDAIDAE